MLIRVASLVLCVALLAFAGPASAQQAPRSLTILSGVAGGGTWNLVAAAIADIFAQQGVRANAEVGGAVSNLINVDTGKAELGFTMTMVPKLAANAEAPFRQKHTDIVAIAVIFPNFAHVMVRADSGVTRLADLKGQPFATQPPGNATQVIFADMLTVAGLSERDLRVYRGSQAEGSELVKDRHAVGITATDGVPSGTLLELATTVDMRFIGLTDEEFEKMKEINSGYVRAVLPANVYPGQTEPVYGVGTDTILIAHKNMPEEHAYWITKTLVENLDQLRRTHVSVSELTPERMADVAGLELHPGARRFYDEYFSR